VEEVEDLVGGGAAVSEACGVRDPLDDSAVFGEGHYVIGSEVKVAPPTRRVLCKEPKNERVQVELRVGDLG